MDDAIEVRFVSGTLELRGFSAVDAGLSGWRRDDRSRCERADALRYRRLALTLHTSGEGWNDRARGWRSLDLRVQEDRAPRPYQHEALEAWRDGGGEGVVVLPTGAGKSWLAVMAMASCQRPTLVVAPTLDLVRQWHGTLRRAFGCEVGVVGGGEHQVEDVTVTTYDSAWTHMEFLGRRFGMIVFDEIHHLPSASYAHAALMSMAPYRLGLTATLERDDGAHERLIDLVGPVVYRRDIVELSGTWLAEYDIERVTVHLSDGERQRWSAAREVYHRFLTQEGIRLGGPQGWGRFIAAACRSEEGRDALKAYRTQRAIALAPDSKVQYVGELLHSHRADRCLLFTADNATAHLLSRRFLVPCITHETRVSERTQILEALRSGEVRAVVTSRVLNEGVDVPEANVAVVISGTGTVREHVQRLGRVLRHHEGKRAKLYELVSEGTSEVRTSARRRDHVAYRVDGMRENAREIERADG